MGIRGVERVERWVDDEWYPSHLDERLRMMMQNH
jgi:hypothetical protein